MNVVNSTSYQRVENDDDIVIQRPSINQFKLIFTVQRIFSIPIMISLCLIFYSEDNNNCATNVSSLIWNIFIDWMTFILVIILYEKSRVLLEKST